MPKFVIGIHGLGNKPPKDLLAKWWLEAIKEGLKNTGAVNLKPAFELIYWADIAYPEPLDPACNDPEDILYLEERYTKSRGNNLAEDHSLRKKVIDFVKSEMDKIFLNEDLSINYSFITDAIMHRFFRDLESYYSDDFTEGDGVKLSGSASLREEIRQRAADILQRHKNDEILLIAHSMGSIVAYDVLTFLVPEIEINTLITIGSPLGLPVVKSKIAAENKNTLNEYRKLITPPGVKRWYNFADIEDFVAINYDLADDFHPGQTGVTVRDFLVHNDYEIDGSKNPHKSFGYLRTPELSSVIASYFKEQPKYFGQDLLRRAKKMLNNLQKRRRHSLNHDPQKPKAA